MKISGNVLVLIVFLMQLTSVKAQDDKSKKSSDHKTVSTTVTESKRITSDDKHAEKEALKNANVNKTQNTNQVKSTEKVDQLEPRPSKKTNP